MANATIKAIAVKRATFKTYKIYEFFGINSYFTSLASVCLPLLDISVL
jgi:hypothetical protein